jgi:hypothetical protein
MSTLTKCGFQGKSHGKQIKMNKKGSLEEKKQFQMCREDWGGLRAK